LVLLELYLALGLVFLFWLMKVTGFPFSLILFYVLVATTYYLPESTPT